MDEYRFSNIKTARDDFDKAFKESRLWFRIWSIVGYVSDILIWFFTLINTINVKVEYINKDASTAMMSIVVSLKTLEATVGFHRRSESSRAVMRYYKMIRDKLDNAIHSMESNDISSEDWSKLVRFCEEIVASARKFPNPSLIKQIDVTKAINELQSIEREILLHRISSIRSPFVHV